ncbi:MAG: zinc ribbon domain-containing protein [Abditibacteriales bacterium]|nr:zinc ribbon domain-containing protein [Abditibacteriales bacterium]MDW8367875.1 zinc ribbon domain-containing protein [Abditibacteriales bacterium]
MRGLLRRITFKKIVGGLAVGFVGIFFLSIIALFAMWWGPPLQSVDRLLPQLEPLRDTLRRRGPQSTSYRELESYAAGTIARAILVTDKHGVIVKAYPRPHFFIGQSLSLTLPLDRAKNQVVDLTSRAGVGYVNGVRAYELVNNDDKLMGYIFVGYDTYAYYSRTRQWEEVLVPVACFAFGIYWLLVALWVFADALANRQRALLWGAFALFTNLIGLLIYLLVKSTTPRLCPRCHRTMEEHFNACPYCGPIRTRLCEKCGSSVQSDWNFCPVCQMPLLDKADVPEMTGG